MNRLRTIQVRKPKHSQGIGSLLLETHASEFTSFFIWDKATCIDDPGALGCYIAATPESSIVINLRSICRAALSLSGEEEGPLTGNMEHLTDLCLVHELAHWSCNDNSKHESWNDFLMRRVIIPLCPHVSEPDSPS